MTLFPYTTLFRSGGGGGGAERPFDGGGGGGGLLGSTGFTLKYNCNCFIIKRKKTCEIYKNSAGLCKK